MVAPSGEGAERAMRMALADAKTRGIDGVDYITVSYTHLTLPTKA